MPYLDTKHKRNSAKITTLIIFILVLLFFVAGVDYLDPPEEYGVAVNFGSSNMGNGSAPMAVPKPSDAPQNNPPADTDQKATPSESTPSPSEQVLTEESPKTIPIKKRKEAEAKTESENKAREIKEAEERLEKERESKRKNVDELFGGLIKNNGADKGGEGNDHQSGNKGQPDGNPYAPRYFSAGTQASGSIGYGLGGRGKPTYVIKQQDCFEYGLVVVKIEVDPSGNVMNATPGIKGTTNTAPCLLKPAKEMALNFKWPADANAPDRQIGYVSINFISH